MLVSNIKQRRKYGIEFRFRFSKMSDRGFLSCEGVSNVWVGFGGDEAMIIIFLFCLFRKIARKYKMQQ